MEERAYAQISPEPQPGAEGNGLRALQPRRRNRTLLLIAAGVAIVALAVTAGVLIGRSGQNPPNAAAAAAVSQSAAPASVSVHGEISLGLFDAVDQTTGSALQLHDGDPCTPTAGFSDISEGTAVNIGGSTGQTLAVGALGAGVLRGNDKGVLVCQFGFQVLAPGGQSLYTVTVSHRGTQTFTPDQIAQGISLTLG